MSAGKAGITTVVINASISSSRRPYCSASSMLPCGARERASTVFSSLPGTWWTVYMNLSRRRRNLRMRGGNAFRLRKSRACDLTQ